MNLQIWKPKVNEVKARVLKNNEAVLDIMSKSIKGARQCPYLGGNKCLGQFCEMFVEFKSIDYKTGQETPFFRCVHVQTPLLLIELCNNIRELNKNIKEK